MKNALLLLVLPFFLLGISFLGPKQDKPVSIIELKKNTIGCAPDPQGNFDTTANGKFILPLPGWGNYSYNISTDNDSAQFYFNQGLNMYYSYHMKTPMINTST